MTAPKMVATVEYHIGTYCGTVAVHDVDPDEESIVVIARARRILLRRCGGTFPPGVESWHETERA